MDLRHVFDSGSRSKLHLESAITAIPRTLATVALGIFLSGCMVKINRMNLSNSGPGTFGALTSLAYHNRAFGLQPTVSYGSDASGQARLAAYLDSACTVPATGTLTVASNPVTLVNGSAYFGTTTYANPGAVEQQIYLGSTLTGSDTVTCATLNPVSVLFPFKSGAGFLRSGSTGVAGATGASELDTVMAVLSDSSGRIVAAGTSNRATGGTEVVVWRYLPDGTPDSGFGSSGLFRSGSSSVAGGSGAGAIDSVFAMTIDSQGRYILVGNSRNASAGTELAIWRLNSNGTLDTTFNGTGSAHYGIPGAAGANTAGTVYDQGYAVTLDANSKIIIAGDSATAAGSTEMAIWRYNSNGTVDTSFNTVGSAHSGGVAGGTLDSGYAVRVDTSGRYVVGGTSQNAANGTEMALWRYTSTGALDTTFAGTGKLHFGSTGAAGETGILEVDKGAALELDSQGRIVVAGHSANASYKFEAVIWRYTSSGTLDTTFNTVGYIHTGSPGVTGAVANMDDRIFDFKIDSSGRYVLVGSSRNSSNGYEVAVLRFNPDGSLDTTFNGTGKLRSGTTGFTGTTGASVSDYGISVAIDSLGRILVGGRSRNSANGWEALIVRYTAKGALDF